MINYFKAAERLLEERSNLDRAIRNLEKRQQRIISANQPAELKAIDFGKQYVSASLASDALSSCLELAEINREIQNTRAMMQEIDDAVGQLEERDAYLIKAWYYRKETKEQIAKQMHYQGVSTIYDLRNKAVAHFAVLYYGAGAIAYN